MIMSAETKYIVGMPDARGGMCYLAGYESDPTRYYTESMALTFASRKGAEQAIAKAKKTHPLRERAYQIIAREPK